VTYALGVSNLLDRAGPANAMAVGAGVSFTAAVHSVHKLRGTVFGSGDPWGGSPAVGYTAAIDNDLATFADVGSGPTVPSTFQYQGYGYLYVGYDMAASAAVVTSVAYAPRSGQQARMVGMTVEGSDDFATWNWTPHFTVSATPPTGVLTRQVAAGSERAFRYIRLEGTSGYLNVAEVEFYGYEVADASVAALSPAAAAPPPVSGHRPPTTHYTSCGLRVLAAAGLFDLRGALLAPGPNRLPRRIRQMGPSAR
jgi:hypothetical protein